MTPIVDGLEAAYSGQLVIKRFNANEGDGPAIMRAYDIPGHPAILIFDPQGQEIERFIGPQSEAAIETILQQELDLRR
jgi:thioredoxin-like negative regulator of GroEL